jgi:hypothetical protein
VVSSGVDIIFPRAITVATTPSIRSVLFSFENFMFSWASSEAALDAFHLSTGFDPWWRRPAAEPIDGQLLDCKYLGQLIDVQSDLIVIRAIAFGADDPPLADPHLVRNAVLFFTLA